MRDLARIIDHTLLAPDATPDRVARLCREAHEHGFYSVCVAPVFVSLAGAELAGSSVQVCTVIGFPTGMSEPEVKAYETELAIRRGADEVDMVMNIGAVRAGDWQQVRLDIVQVVDRADGRPVKVILETCLLKDEEKQRACAVCVDAGAAFVKTSTGFSHGGATEADVRLMRAAVGPDPGVKASGGIRDYATACKMITAGATRLGTSSGLKIVAGEKDLSAADAY